MNDNLNERAARMFLEELIARGLGDVLNKRLTEMHAADLTTDGLALWVAMLPAETLVRLAVEILEAG